MVVLLTPEGGVAKLVLGAGFIAGGCLLDVSFELQQGMATVNQISPNIG